MATTVHILDVGAGNMVLIQTDDGKNILYDCNVTEENGYRVLSYLRNAVGTECKIDVFICSHRDADHIRGIGILNNNFEIGKIWDNGRSARNKDTDENNTYIGVRDEVGYVELKGGECVNFGQTSIEVLFAGDMTLPNDPNTQSIVLRIRHDDSAIGSSRSVLLTGDSDMISWQNSIMLNIDTNLLKSDFLLASHHGSYSFFGSTAEKNEPYTNHIKAIAPCLTIISTDGETHNHPDRNAETLYNRFSYGARNGEKVIRTDIDGTIKIIIDIFLKKRTTLTTSL